jgi:hypothetical protein
MLASDLHADLVAEGIEVLHHLAEWLGGPAGVDDHHHVEVALHDGLGDVLDIDLVVCKVGADLRDDPDGIFPDDCDDGLFHALVQGVHWRSSGINIVAGGIEDGRGDRVSGVSAGSRGADGGSEGVISVFFGEYAVEGGGAPPLLLETVANRVGRAAARR